jgi:hypothetical protein
MIINMQLSAQNARMEKNMDKEEVMEILDLMYAGEITSHEAMSMLDGFDGDLAEFL